MYQPIEEMARRDALTKKIYVSTQQEMLYMAIRLICQIKGWHLRLIINSKKKRG
jgi:hypothetical protein